MANRASVLVCGRLPEEALAILARDAQVEVADGRIPLARLVGSHQGLIALEGACLSSDVLEAGRELRVVAGVGQAISEIDVEAATRQGIVVLSAAGSIASAAELALGLLLALARRLPQAQASLRAGRWERGKFVGVQLRRRTLGLIGLGHVGSEVAKRARGLEMRVIAHDPFVSPEYAEGISVPLLSQDEVLAQADFVSLHVPLTAQTAGLIGARELGKMRHGALLVNASAPAVVDYSAALASLQGGQLGGLAMDVPPDDEALGAELMRQELVIITPRLSGWTVESQRQAALEVVSDALGVLAGQPAKLAVNTLAVGEEAFASLRPYVSLAENLGRLLSQLSEGCWKETEVIFQGEVAQGSTAPLLSAAAAGILKRALPERANLANALLLAKSRGMSVVERKDLTTPERYANLITLRSPAPHFVDEVSGTVVEGHPCVVRLGRHWVNIFPSGGHLFLSFSQDRPGIMGRVGTLLGEAGISFSSLQLGRRGPEGQALMVMKLDEPLPPALMPSLLGAASAVDGRLVVF